MYLVKSLSLARFRQSLTLISERLRQLLPDRGLLHLPIGPAIAIPVRPVPKAAGTLPTATAVAFAVPVHHLKPEKPAVAVVPIIRFRMYRFGDLRSVFAAALQDSDLARAIIPT